MGKIRVTIKRAPLEQRPCDSYEEEAVKIVVFENGPDIPSNVLFAKVPFGATMVGLERNGKRSFHLIVRSEGERLEVPVGLPSLLEDRRVLAALYET